VAGLKGIKMKHEWKDGYVPEELDFTSQVFRRFRKCKHCGKVQEYEKEHNWGRVVGGRWNPLVGRCTGVYEKVVLVK
jgi:hypothetical protein